MRICIELRKDVNANVILNQLSFAACVLALPLMMRITSSILSSAMSRPCNIWSLYMRLRALTGLEREKLEQEHAELLKKIDEYKAILADKKLLLGVIKTEIMLISDKYGDDRRTKFGYDEFPSQSFPPQGSHMPLACIHVRNS